MPLGLLQHHIRSVPSPPGGGAREASEGGDGFGFGDVVGEDAAAGGDGPTIGQLAGGAEGLDVGQLRAPVEAARGATLFVATGIPLAARRRNSIDASMNEDSELAVQVPVRGPVLLQGIPRWLEFDGRGDRLRT